MANNNVEPGLELVLDNRKLILAFGLLIAICGLFFVVGFIEGKRQGFQEANQAATETSPKPVPEVAVQTPSEKSVKEEAKPVPPEAADQPLDWYKNINRKGEAAVPTSPTPAQDSVAKKPATATAAVTGAKPTPDASLEPVTYSVQVGAFRQKHEMELRAQMLRDKGFECRSEPPAEPGQFYLLKVGKFRTRAEASAMQLRLKSKGFSSFIKTN